MAASSPTGRKPGTPPGSLGTTKERQGSAMSKKPISNPRLTLAETAELVVARLWPDSGDIRLHKDRVRKRIERDVISGKLRVQKDDTFSLVDVAEWLRRTSWSGLGEPQEFPDLPGQRRPFSDRYTDKKHHAHIDVTVGEMKHTSPLDKLTTVEACHQEILRLNLRLDAYFREIQKLFKESLGQERRRVRQEAGRKGFKNRMSKK